MKQPRITLAVNSYDRHAPLLEGAVSHPDFVFDVLEVGQSQPGRHGTGRHERFLGAKYLDREDAAGVGMLGSGPVRKAQPT